MQPKPLTLVILDGWGASDSKQGNAILAANTPNYDELLKTYPNTLIGAAGADVGLPAGQMGNSEVGHLNIGAGRIVLQDLTRIDEAIENGTFYENPFLLEAIENVKIKKSNLHFMGLVSDGGVHSQLNHLYALLELAKSKGINPCVHAFLDGRDVAPQSARIFLSQLEDKMAGLGTGRIATVSGRYYAMDRDNRWERVEKAYRALVDGQGEVADNAGEAVEIAYSRAENDEFVKPTVIEARGERRDRIKEHDSIIFFNFRPDRARELTRAFIDPDFKGFDRGSHPPHVFFVSMTQYDATFDIPIAFPQRHLKNILADVLAKNGLKQLRIAETEKYAHVTFFFNGGEEDKRPGEDRILIPSPKVATYDLMPEMSAHKVTDKVVGEVNGDKYDVIILNYANPDMVGHTGFFDAAVKAIETIDECVGSVVGAVKEKGGAVLITADHGNAEAMVDIGGGPQTAHTTDKVPFIYITNHVEARRAVPLRNDGILADIAPTMLDILGIEKPDEMTGRSLIIKSQAPNSK
ncbi:MAG: 2,3-bisphosphoglycerate-independent phosphoglycerate mutase [Actinobacteria bacterium]|nr:MAG: 2,3-bisphosphoglycerate-independent phosphoglycerate mutase [Actinomycetota bacterium]